MIAVLQHQYVGNLRSLRQAPKELNMSEQERQQLEAVGSKAALLEYHGTRAEDVKRWARYGSF